MIIHQHTHPTMNTLPSSLEEIRSVAIPAFADEIVHSVGVNSWIGEVVVFRDLTIKFRMDCPELD
jgi:hypothetical protein